VTAPPLDPTGADRRLRVVYCAVPTLDLAQKLAEEVVRRRLAGCANFWPIRSTYLWRGKLENAEEVAMLFKTSPKKLGALFRYVAAHHPYEVPDLFEVQVPRVHEPFIAWLLASIDPRSAEPVPLKRSGSRPAPAARARPRTRAPRHRRY
jgi:periplasmic divalent cation tolerance protein